MPREKWDDKLCEINVASQVYHLGNSTILQQAWERGQDVKIHGWIYGTSNGILRDLGVTATSRESLEVAYQSTMSSLLPPLEQELKQHQAQRNTRK